MWEMNCYFNQIEDIKTPKWLKLQSILHGKKQELLIIRDNFDHSSNFV